MAHDVESSSGVWNKVLRVLEDCKASSGDVRGVKMSAISMESIEP